MRVLAVAIAVAAAPVAAQDHAMHDMGGTAMPAPPAAHEHPATTPPPAAGEATPPPVPADWYADRFYPADAMARARAEMMREGGGQTYHLVLFNLAEVQARRGRDGYRWDGEGWFGGDVNRAVVKTEGSGAFRDGPDAAEAQLLYSRAIGPYFNLQGGIRHDFAPTPTRTFATIGVEGLAPYMFQVEAALFVAGTGQVLGRLETWYDQRLTQRLVLQPRVELNLAAQDDAATSTGAGLSEAEIGLRLRYEFARTFAPYVGVSYEATTGHTADYARADGGQARSAAFVTGVRFWF